MKWAAVETKHGEPMSILTFDEYLKAVAYLKSLGCKRAECGGRVWNGTGPIHHFKLLRMKEGS